MSDRVIQPRHARRMALDWDGWEQSLPEGQRIPVREQISQYMTPQEGRQDMIVTAWMKERTGRPVAEVARNKEQFMGGIAAQMGWDEAKGDPAAFYNRVIKDIQDQEKVHTYRYGFPDDSKVTADERKGAWEKSLANRAYKAASEEAEDLEAPEKTEFDILEDFAAWQAENRNSSSYVPGNEDRDYQEWLRFYNVGQTDKLKAMAAAKSAYPVIVSAADVGGADIEKALPFFRELTDDQKGLALQYLSVLGTRTSSTGVVEDMSGAEQALVAAGRTQANMWRSFLAGQSELDDVFQQQYKPGQKIYAGHYNKILDAMGSDAPRQGKKDTGTNFPELTPEMVAYVDQKRAEIQRDKALAFDLMEVAQGNLDPLRRDTIWQKAYLGAAESATAMAYTATPLGAPIRFGAYTYDAQQKLRQQGVSEEAARTIAPFIGGAQAALDHAALSFLKKVPGVDALITRYATNALVRFGARTAGTLAAETAVELTQDFLVEGLAKDAYSWLTGNIPGTDWSKVGGDMLKATPDTIYAMLLLAPFGAGLAHRGDYKGMDNLVRNPDALRLLGYSEDKINLIVTAPKDVATTIFKDNWDSRTISGTGDRRGVTFTQASEWANKTLEQQKKTAAESYPVEEAEGGFTVPDDAGEFTTFPTREAAEDASLSRTGEAAERAFSEAVQSEAASYSLHGGLISDTKLNEEAGVRQFFRDERGWHLVTENGKLIDAGTLENANQMRAVLATGNLQEQVVEQEEKLVAAAKAAAETARQEAEPKTPDEKEEEGQRQPEVLRFVHDAATPISPENEQVRAELETVAGDILPYFGNVFSGVEIVDSVPDRATGGFFRNPETGALGVSLSDARRELGRVKDKRKWVATALTEEAIHAVTRQLEKDGQLNSGELLQSLKEEARPAYDKFRQLYKTADEGEAALEFVRMVAQGRIKFDLGKGVVINGELTEMQLTPRFIKAVRDALNKVLVIIRDLKKRLPAELGETLDEKATLIEETLRSLIQGEEQTTGGGEVDQSTPPPSTSDAPAGAVLSTPVGLTEGVTPEGDVKSEKATYGAANRIVSLARREMLKQRFKESLGRAQSGLSPRQLLDSVELAVFHIEAGARKFAEFSAQMVEDLGERIKPHLRDIYNRALSYFDKEPVEGGKEAPELTASEIAALDEGATGIKNAVTDELRRRYGLEGAKDIVTETHAEVLTEAMDRVKSDKGYTDRLIGELTEQPRTLTPVEEAALMMANLEVQAEIEEVTGEITRAADEKREQDAAELTPRLAEARAKAQALFDIERAAGTAWGRSGNFRRRMLHRDFSLVKMEADYRTAANEGKKLTEEQAEYVLKLQRQLQKAEQQIRELESRSIDSTVEGLLQDFFGSVRQTQKEASKARQEGRSIRVFLKEKADEARGRMAKRRTQLGSGGQILAELGDWSLIGAHYIAEGAAKVTEFTKRLVSEFGDEMKEHAKAIFEASKELHQSLSEDTPERQQSSAKKRGKAKAEAAVQKADGNDLPDRKLVYNLAEAHVRGGKHGSKEVFAAVTADLQESFPGITERQVKEVFSDYGKATFPSQNEIKRELRELRRISQLEITLERLRAKQAPLKTGPQRDKATAEIRALEKQVNELKRKLGFTQKSPTQLAGVLDAVKTRLRNEIEDIEARIGRGGSTTDELTPRKGLTYDAEALELKKKRDDLKAELAKLDGPKTITEARRIEITLNALERTEELLTRELETGKKAAKTPAAQVTNNEIEERRSYIATMRQELAERKAAEKPKKPQDEINLARDKKSIARRTAELERRLKEGDFSKKKRREKKYDDELRNAEAEYEKLREQWFQRLFEESLKNRTLRQKVRDGIRETFFLSRLIQLGLDFGALLRQGGKSLGRPKAIARALVKGVESLRSEQGELRTRLDLMKDPQVPIYIQAGLEITDWSNRATLSKQEEAWMGRWITKIPKWMGGGVVRGTGRGQVTFLNKLRVEMMRGMCETLSRFGAPTMEEMQNYARMVNASTGRGTMTQVEKSAMGVLNILFLAYRWAKSGLQYISLHPVWYPWIKKTGTLRSTAVIAAEYARNLSGIALIYGIYQLAKWGHGEDDDQIETDPRSAKFGKLKFGDTYVDPTAGMASWITLLARLTTGEKKIQGGEVMVIAEQDGERPRFGDSRFSLTADFLRTKLNPIIGAVINTAEGRDPSGQQTNAGQEGFRLFTPLIFRDIYGAIRENGVPEGVALSTLAFFGMSIQSRDEKRIEDLPTQDRNWLYNNAITLPRMDDYASEGSLRGMDKADAKEEGLDKPLSDEVKAAILKESLPAVQEAVLEAREALKDLPEDEEERGELLKEVERDFGRAVREAREDALDRVIERK